MSLFEKIITYIKKRDPTYEYENKDFLVICKNGITTIENWTLDLKKPSLIQLNKITEPEISTQLKNPYTLRELTFMFDELTAKLKESNLID